MTPLFVPPTEISQSFIQDIEYYYEDRGTKLVQTYMYFHA